jgi:hypothetical protein
MVGRFDDQLKLSQDGTKIIMRGPTEWKTTDQNRVVRRLRAEVIQNNHTCNGQNDSDQRIRQGVDSTWEFEMDNNNGMLGTATAVGKARMEDGTERTWTQTVEIVPAS